MAKLDQSNIAIDKPRKFLWLQFSLSTWLQAKLLNDKKIGVNRPNFVLFVKKHTGLKKKSTPPPVLAVLANMSYELSTSYKIELDWWARMLVATNGSH